MFKLVRSSDTTSRNHNGSYTITNYLTKEFSKDFSIAVSKMTNGNHELTRSVTSDRIYYFIEAQAEFVIGNETLAIRGDDVLFIEKNTDYSFSGTFKAVLINLPAFRIEDDRK